MPFNVNDIRQQFTAGGARPNLFEISMPFPTAAGADAGAAASKLTFMAHGAQIPGADFATIEVPYFGRQIKMPGNRTFVEWTPTVYNDEDFLIHNALNTWMNSINSHVSNVRSPIAVSTTGYCTNADVIHYSKAGDVIKRVTLVNVWPSSIAPIDLDWGTNDVLEEFAVTFQYDYWVSSSVENIAGVSEFVVGDSGMSSGT